jgi:glycosyltransferase involved in cell wall biosynthesis
MKVIISGLPYFSKKLAADLNSTKSQHSFIFLNTYESFIDKIKFFLSVPFADVVISMNGVSDKSGSLDWAILLKKKIWMQWQGSDVLNAIRRKNNNTLNLKYIKNSYQSTDATWLFKELKTIDINCEINQFKWTEFKKLSNNYTDISVYSYLLEGKEDFYGWKRIENLAINNPKIEFKIAGTSGNQLKKHPNVHFLGWLSKDKFEQLRIDSPIFLRLPEHDGYSLSVIDALAAGNEVLWSTIHPKCYFSKKEDDEKVFTEIVSKLEGNGLKRNKENIEFAYVNFSKESNLNTLIRNLEQFNERKS